MILKTKKQFCTAVSVITTTTEQTATNTTASAVQTTKQPTSLLVTSTDFVTTKPITTETTTNPTTTVTAATTTFVATTVEEPRTTSQNLTVIEATTTHPPELSVHCCCRCCWDMTSSPLTSSCTVCGDESLADAAQCAAEPPPTPKPFTRPTEPNFEPPAQLEGSQFAERLAFTEDFLAKEQLTEMLASLSLNNRVALGFTASEFILDCSYDGVPCNLDT